MLVKSAFSLWLRQKDDNYLAFDYLLLLLDRNSVWWAHHFLLPYYCQVVSTDKIYLGSRIEVLKVHIVDDQLICVTRSFYFVGSFSIPCLSSDSPLYNCDAQSDPYDYLNKTFTVIIIICAIWVVFSLCLQTLPCATLIFNDPIF